MIKYFKTNRDIRVIIPSVESYCFCCSKELNNKCIGIYINRLRVGKFQKVLCYTCHLYCFKDLLKRNLNTTQGFFANQANSILNELCEKYSSEIILEVL